MRSSGGTKSGLAVSVVARTKARIACLAGAVVPRGERIIRRLGRNDQPGNNKDNHERTNLTLSEKSHRKKLPLSHDAPPALPNSLATRRYHQWFGMPLIMQPPSVCMLEISQPVVTET